jgi:hypothetical protein
VFPCAVQGKQPAIKGGFHAATTNPATIERYWRLADRNIGIPTGSASGFWVLDIDGELGEASLAALERIHGPLPATRTVLTGGGGRHLWFRYTGPIPSTAGRIGPGLDTRGDGGFVIVPPSVHPNGRRYEFLQNDHRWSFSLAAAPEWLERLARKKISERALENMPRPKRPRAVGLAEASKAYGLAALEREIADLVAALPGTRNAALNCAGFKLFQLVAGGELDDGEVVERLIDACHRNGLVNDDGWQTVMATIRSARDGMKHPRSRAGGT